MMSLLSVVRELNYTSPGGILILDGEGNKIDGPFETQQGAFDQLNRIGLTEDMVYSLVEVKAYVVRKSEVYVIREKEYKEHR
jgi:hypothetical protein